MIGSFRGAGIVAAVVPCAAMMIALRAAARAEPTPAPSPSPPPPIGRVSVATSSTRALTTLSVPADTIGRAEIRATAGRTIESSLAAIPGFAQTGTDARFTHPHDGSISLGGSGGGIGAAKALVLLDGMPITNVNGGWVDWSRVPKLLVDRIEAVRTGASSLYGTQAIGGVIAIETRVSRERETMADVFAGTLGTAGAAIARSERIGARSSVSVYADDQKSDGFRSALAPNPSQPTSRYRGQRAFLRTYAGDTITAWRPAPRCSWIIAKVIPAGRHTTSGGRPSRGTARTRRTGKTFRRPHRSIRRITPSISSGPPGNRWDTAV